jgi:hypothetical protein
LDSAYLTLAQSKALFINPQTFFVDMICRSKKGKKDEHFTACWENKELFSKLILSVLEFTRFFFTVVICRYELELKKMQDIASGSSASSAAALDDGIRNTFAAVESKKSISAFQHVTADCTTDDKQNVALAAQRMEQSAQKTLAVAGDVPLTLRDDSKTRYALSKRAGFVEELKTNMFVIVKQDVALYEWARPAEANAFGGQMQKVRLCVTGNPYKIESVCQTTTEPMGL